MTPIEPSPQPSSGIQPTSVDVWLTLGDESKKLSHERDLTFLESPPNSASQIAIDQNNLYQQFEGAGAAMTESSAWLIMSILDSTSRQELMRDLFTRQGDGIGISYIRLPMGASDFALKDYSYDDLPKGQDDPALNNFSIAHDKAYIIPALKLALELDPQLGIMGSPWSPPAWMKKDGLFHGSYLLPEYFQTFADYHIRFIQAYADEGITIDSITPPKDKIIVGIPPTAFLPSHLEAGAASESMSTLNVEVEDIEPLVSEMVVTMKLPSGTLASAIFQGVDEEYYAKGKLFSIQVDGEQLCLFDPDTEMALQPQT